MTRPVVPPPITATVAPLGPNARAMLEDRPLTRAAIADTMYMLATEPPENHGALRPLSPMPTRLQPSPRPTVLRLLADTKAVILRRRQECYGGLAISDEQADELSRALVQHLVGEYSLDPL